MLDRMEMRAIKPPSRELGPERWDAVLLAGDRPDGDPLAKHFGVTSKALVVVAGRPMLDHVLETLVNHPRISRVIVLAQRVDELLANPGLEQWRGEERVFFVRSGNSIAGSLSTVLRNRQNDWPVLVTTCDHVLLDHPMVDWFLDEACECDVAVGTVNRKSAATEELDCGRTWIRFKDVQVSGANLFALRSDRVLAGLDFWQKIESHRKKPWRMAWEVGPSLLLRLLLKQIPFENAISEIGQRLGLDARALQIPYARAGVDVDKLSDHALVESLLARSSG